jgi:hypothetical protein
MMAAIQMKNQKDHRSTSPKLLVIASMASPSSHFGIRPIFALKVERLLT